MEISHDKLFFACHKRITPIFYQNVPWYPFYVFLQFLYLSHLNKNRITVSRLVIFNFVVVTHLSSHKFLHIVFFYLDQHHHDVNERTLA